MPAETYAAMAGAPVGELSGFEGLDVEAVQGFTVSSAGGDVGEDSTRRLSAFAKVPDTCVRFPLLWWFRCVVLLQ